MAKFSPAQRRKAHCGPAFRQSYIDDGWRAGAAHIISAFARLRAASEIRRRYQTGDIRASDALRISYITLLHARKDLRIGRRMTPLPA
ncbi:MULTISPECIES: hypothetical protein [unclassified Agrobacterium]|uniref:hypothetical protein n=1 Tax=unclassified Agrobacterium TaxID=2632611 RepID=UPI002448F7A8|nr:MULTISPECIES: hypothetical protein [unclassified Agrobacterium]MDH0615899.1 hypothetical protein [Agrobacterium sp. GD03872]MDH0698014.1 hypothetical protein [Agrobacterium sp. GD03871]MDH1061099.1 hypothetical protein [Agrobacterium sp. GD03992]MDH2211869.1 hypothetical protein [Agrobacterium sp. GD03643]MDH2221261.1 hypothetical protein [Agrobacterium sp. GD03638]